MAPEHATPEDSNYMANAYSALTSIEDMGKLILILNAESVMLIVKLVQQAYQRNSDFRIKSAYSGILREVAAQVAENLTPGGRS